MSGTTVYANLYGKRRRLIFSRVGDRSGLDRRLPHVRGHPLLDAGRSQRTPINVCICVAVESTRALNTSDEPVFLLWCMHESQLSAARRSQSIYLHSTFMEFIWERWADGRASKGDVDGVADLGFDALSFVPRPHTRRVIVLGGRWSSWPGRSVSASATAARRDGMPRSWKVVVTGRCLPDWQTGRPQRPSVIDPLTALGARRPTAGPRGHWPGYYADHVSCARQCRLCDIMRPMGRYASQMRVCTEIDVDGCCSSTSQQRSSRNLRHVTSTLFTIATSTCCMVTTAIIDDMIGQNLTIFWIPTVSNKCADITQLL